MKYQITINFAEGIPKEKIEYLVASLRYRKKFTDVLDHYPVENAWLSVADEPPLDEEE